eukprot:gnl/MRDRNA2_/MRDRNA2_72171_c0_seq1.p1 gnl/MRDRNA2_/MRDRNA2_72171_c0~~gnl/MRDRNA2_/MRDRNA2_72171_c0_seq1.p1  ORF type:complete len:958 (-),score=187.75 gnl/MRDRNA2_/MRDRNA2_72171_c0_seq1:82-2955(-)
MVVRRRSNPEIRASSTGGAISVAVRVRPIKLDEAGEEFAVSLQGPVVTVRSQEQIRDFYLDQCFWSSNPMDPNYASQEDVFRGMGTPMLSTMLAGYHGAMLFCGQHGAGKTSSLMGTGDESGILPRILEQLFQEQEIRKSTLDAFTISLSYFELYQGQVVDLLQPPSALGRLTVCEHPINGTFLPGLSICPVASMAEVQNLLFDFGNRNRIALETNLNPRSVIAHLFLSIHLRPYVCNDAGLVARLDLIELGCFERMQGIGEAAKWCSDPSLQTLSRMVDALGREQNENIVLHTMARTSQLTSLLRQPLSGSCRTSLLAAVAPTVSAVPWTLRTLEFAVAVRQLRTAPKPCQLPAETAKVFKDEIAILTEWLRSSYHCGRELELNQEIQIRSNLVRELDCSATERALHAAEHAKSRQAQLFEWGQSDADQGKNSTEPFLQNISMDPLLTGALVYFLRSDRRTRIGSGKGCAVWLQGIGIRELLCEISNVSNRCLSMNVATGGRVLKNGEKVLDNQAVPLSHQDRLIFGFSRIYRVVVPLMWNEICESAFGRPNALKDQCLRASVMDYAACLREVKVDDFEIGTWSEYLKSVLPNGECRAALALDAVQEALPLVTEATTLVALLYPDIGWSAAVDISVEALLESEHGHVVDAILVRVSQKGVEMQRWIYSQFKEFLEKLRDKCSNEVVEKKMNDTSSKGVVGDLDHIAIGASSAGDTAEVMQSFGADDGALRSMYGTLPNEVALRVMMARGGSSSSSMPVRKRSGPPPALVRPRGGPPANRSGGNAGPLSMAEAPGPAGEPGDTNEVVLPEQSHIEPPIEDLQAQLRRYQAKRQQLEYERDRILQDDIMTCALVDETNRALDVGRREVQNRHGKQKKNISALAKSSQPSVTVMMGGSQGMPAGGMRRMQSQPVISAKQAVGRAVSPNQGVGQPVVQAWAVSPRQGRSPSPHTYRLMIK